MSTAGPDICSIKGTRTSWRPICMRISPSTIEPVTACSIASEPRSAVSSNTFMSWSRAPCRTPSTTAMASSSRPPERNGITSPMLPVRLERSARAPAWGRYPSASMLAVTRSRVSGEIVRFPVSTYDTVLGATPACRATSVIVAGTWASSFGRIDSILTRRD